MPLPIPWAPPVMMTTRGESGVIVTSGRVKHDYSRTSETSSPAPSPAPKGYPGEGHNFSSRLPGEERGVRIRLQFRISKVENRMANCERVKGHGNRAEAKA